MEKETEKESLTERTHTSETEKIVAIQNGEEEEQILCVWYWLEVSNLKIEEVQEMLKMLFNYHVKNDLP